MQQAAASAPGDLSSLPLISGRSIFLVQVDTFACALPIIHLLLERSYPGQELLLDSLLVLEATRQSLELILEILGSDPVILVVLEGGPQRVRLGLFVHLECRLAFIQKSWFAWTFQLNRDVHA